MELPMVKPLCLLPSNTPHLRPTIGRGAIAHAFGGPKQPPDSKSECGARSSILAANIGNMRGALPIYYGQWRRHAGGTSSTLLR
jgi:hypothetical protein